MHERDKPLLQDIKNFFGVGKIYKQGLETIQYLVISIEDLAKIIHHFKINPLKSKKCADFELFSQAFELIKAKEHLTEEGFYKILTLKASINWGLSDNLKAAFPAVVPVERPEVFIQNNLEDPFWLAGFTSGEGCFLINIYKSQTKLGETVKLEFQLTQHIRDENLIKSFISFFQCGTIRQRHDALDFRVYKLSDITDKIIPFFQKYRIRGVKALDFEDWCKVAEMMKVKKHLTAEGLEEIRKIKAGVNRGRKLY